MITSPDSPPARRDPGHQTTSGRAIAIMVASALFACVGQLMWKIGATRGEVFIVVGFLLYGAGALLMLLAYRHGELSVLQPVLGLSYALSLVLGAWWLGEQVSVGRVVGVGAVIVGVVVLARGATARTSP